MSWQALLKENATSADDLKVYMDLTDEEVQKLQEILEQFPMSIPQYYLSLIDWEDENDPIRKLCIPSIWETNLDGTFDTSGEADNTVVPGLQHKYPKTVLFLSTNQCAMYCRHCFRKRLVGISEDEIGRRHFDKIADYIRSHEEISNILISGGDSFLNSNSSIEQYLKVLTEIDHLDCIRFGTRTPVSFPMRITMDPDLLNILSRYNQKKQIYVVTHFNHPNEITSQSVKALEMLQDAGVKLLNQTVLLKGINDDSQILGSLFKKLISTGVIPYYIFQCRPVSGVKHQFQVPIKEGCHIIEEAKKLLNGLEKPFRYIMSHETGKIEILGPIAGREMLFKYHQAKNPDHVGRLFTKPLDELKSWL